MSGIFGLLQKNGEPVSPGFASAMAHPVSFWGPDGINVWSRGPVALGHMLLWMTPEAPLGPVTLPQLDHLTVTADVRLDNRAEISDALGIPDKVDRPDEHLLLQGYAKWGEDVPSRLLGDFVFAIFDSREQSLFLATSQLGLRPLFYYDSPTVFAFASDIRAILAVPGVPHDMDADWYLALHSTAFDYVKPRTAYRSITPVHEGQIIKITRRGMTRRTYWDPNNLPRIQMSAADAADGLRQHMERAVAVCLRTHRPVAAHVSGGLDSTAVAVLASRKSRAAGSSFERVYSWSPPPEDAATLPEWDERWAVETICRREGWECVYTVPTVEQEVETALLDYAFYPHAAAKETACAEHAAQSGTGLILSGWGGDELASHSGGGMWEELWRSGQWRALWAKAREMGKATGRPAWRTALAPVLIPRMPQWILRLRGRESPAWQPLVRKVVPREHTRFLPAERLPVPKSVRDSQIGMFRDGHIAHRTWCWATRGSANRIEYRYPLLDRRLVEFVLSLPGTVWVADGRARALFRRAAADLLPPRLAQRSKDQEFGSPKRERPEVQRRLDEILGAAQLSPHLRTLAIVRPALRALHDASGAFQEAWISNFQDAAAVRTSQR